MRPGVLPGRTGAVDEPERQGVVTVPRLWPGETVVVLGTGPSLCAADVDACRGQARVIAIKDAIDLAPWADVLYGCGADAGQWWARNGDRLAGFPGLRYTLDPKAAPWATVLRQGAQTGLSTDPGALCTGTNSGVQAIGLAFLLGAARILLLGCDGQAAPNGRDHFFGAHPYARAATPYAAFRRGFDAIAGPIAAHGVTVLNCTVGGALECFPRGTLQDELSRLERVA